MPSGEAGKAVAVDQVPGGGGDDADADGTQGGGRAAILQRARSPTTVPGPGSPIWCRPPPRCAPRRALGKCRRRACPVRDRLPDALAAMEARSAAARREHSGSGQERLPYMTSAARSPAAQTADSPPTSVVARVLALSSPKDRAVGRARRAERAHPGVVRLCGHAGIPPGASLWLRPGFLAGTPPGPR